MIEDKAVQAAPREWVDVADKLATAVQDGIRNAGEEAGRIWPDVVAAQAETAIFTMVAYAVGIIVLFIFFVFTARLAKKVWANLDESKKDDVIPVAILAIASGIVTVTVMAAFLVNGPHLLATARHPEGVFVSEIIGRR